MRAECVRCGKRGVVHSTHVERGVVTRIHFCDVCARLDDDLASVEQFARAAYPDKLPQQAVEAVSRAPLQYERVDAPGDETRWFAAGMAARVRCCACREELRMVRGLLDHRPQRCPSCGVICLLFAWGDFFVQMVPTLAPPEFAKALALFQDRLDVREFLVAMSCLQDLFDAMRS